MYWLLPISGASSSTGPSCASQTPDILTYIQTHNFSTRLEAFACDSWNPLCQFCLSFKISHLNHFYHCTDVEIKKFDAVCLFNHLSIQWWKPGMFKCVNNDQDVILSHYPIIQLKNHKDKFNTLNVITLYILYRQSWCISSFHVKIFH